MNDFLGPISSRLATRRENFGTLSSKYKLMIRKLMNCTPLSKDSDRDVFCYRENNRQRNESVPKNDSVKKFKHLNNKC